MLIICLVFCVVFKVRYVLIVCLVFCVVFLVRYVLIVCLVFCVVFLGGVCVDHMFSFLCCV